MRDVTLLDLTDYKTVKKGKRLVSAFLDYFLVVIFSLLFFSAAYPVYEALPITKDIKNSYQERQDDTISILKETHLQSYNDKNVAFDSVEKDGDRFIRSLIKTSFYKNGMKYYEQKDDIKEEVSIQTEDLLGFSKDGVFTNDSIGEYYLHFRNDNLGSYCNNKIQSMTRGDLNHEILKLDQENKDIVVADFDLEETMYLSKESASLLSDYVNFQDESGKELYQRMMNLYKSSIQNGIQEIESSYQPYLDSLEMFRIKLGEYSTGFNVTMMLCYLLSFLICYVFFPLCFKRGRTISYRFNSLFPLRNDGSDLTLFNYLIKYFVLFVEQFSSLFFLALFLGKLQVLSLPFLGSITMFQLLVFSFLISLVSIGFLFISKDNQTLSEFASMSYTVDSRTPNEEKKVIKGNRTL